MSHLTTGLVQVLFLAAGMVATGIFAIAWRRDQAAAVAGIPLVFGGGGIAFVGIARFAARAAAAGPAPPPRWCSAGGGSLSGASPASRPGPPPPARRPTAQGS